MKRVLTYGTYDLLHYGHIRLLKRAKALGDYLIVAISTDEFNAGKGKKAYHSYETRKEMLEAVRYVDLVIPEETFAVVKRLQFANASLSTRVTLSGMSTLSRPE